MSYNWNNNYIADNAFNYPPHTSTQQNYIVLAGDTIRITEKRTISSSVSNGYQGELCYDDNYIYVCTATNTWKRLPATSW